MCCRHRMAVLLCALAIGGCERAHRFPLPIPAEAEKTPAATAPFKAAHLLPQYGWFKSFPRPDVPIRFVAEDTDPKTWQKLKEFWTGWPAVPLQVSPLEAAATLQGQLALETITIKVPRGLPDPTPFIPAVNQPTLGKWMLGKRLFFDDKLLKLSMTQSASCASCHLPDHGFAADTPTSFGSSRNVPSLINCVYNRHQFWDGRADALEQVLLRNLDDERDFTSEPLSGARPAQLHVWPGIVDRIRVRPDYQSAFERVFGTHPTADNICKALATYMRTLLSGNALWDRAQLEMKKRGGKSMEARDFEILLSGPALKIFVGPLSPQEVAVELSRGHHLFNGRARCHECHGGPLFTDHGFHNVGIGDSELHPEAGKEPGRFAVAPLGLKDATLIGAYKTPSLRNVSLTAPYTHDGSIATLEEVIKYFNDGIKPNEFLSPRLIEQIYQPRQLLLDRKDQMALELYLRALQGDELPAFVISAPEK